MKLVYRVSPSLALVVTAVLAILGDAFISRVVGPSPTTITVYNRTTAAITFATGDLRKTPTYVPACTTIQFEVVRHEWHLVGQPAVPAPGAADPVAIVIGGAIPPVPDANGPAQWELVVSSDRMDGGEVYVGRPNPPPCDGPPREPVVLAGIGALTAGPYHLGGGYLFGLSIAVPDSKGCVFGATMRRAGQTTEERFIDDRVLYADLTIKPGSTGYAPGEYELTVHSACGPWEITLTPR